MTNSPYLSEINLSKTYPEASQMVNEASQEIGLFNPRSSITYLLWSRKTSGITSLEILLENLEYDSQTRELRNFIPPRDRQEFYKKLGLDIPDVELVLRSNDPQIPIPFKESIQLYWDLLSRRFSIASYTFNDEGERVIENISPDLRQKVQQ